MPLSFRVDRQLDLVITTADGQVTEEDVQAHTRRLLTVDGRPTRELVDFGSLASITVNLNSVRDAGEFLRARDRTPGGRLALVAGSDAVYGALRIFQAHRDDDALDISVFRDREAALRWLGIPESQWQLL